MAPHVYISTSISRGASGQPVGASRLLQPARHSVHPLANTKSHAQLRNRHKKAQQRCIRCTGLRESQEDSLEELEWEDLLELETNLDDLSPQVVAYTCNLLLEKGALDAWTVPCVMKKGRLGVVLHVLCREEQRDEMILTLLQETSSLGVRVKDIDRAAVPRSFTAVNVEGQMVQMKIGSLQGDAINVQPEYEDCVAAAKSLAMPLKQVQQLASLAYWIALQQQR